MTLFDSVLAFFPQVRSPQQKKLPFNEKLKWTLLMLVVFFVLGLVPLYGLGENALAQFEFLSIILGASFGSIISLGIGPLVTSSIVLQLLSGTGILKFDLVSPEGKKRYHGYQKLLSVFFIVFEACVYVFMGGLAPAPVGTMLPSGVAMTSVLFREFELVLVAQLILGGLIIMFMDEVISKWGFGSGISLFIVGGVAQQIFIRLLNPLASTSNAAAGIVLGYPFGSEAPVGKLWEILYGLSQGDPTMTALAIGMIVATLVIFAVCVYGQALKVEIPLSFGKVRGYGMRWPLNFFYTSNIPVILVAALMANIQLFATLFERWGHPILGTFSGNSPISGVVFWISPPNLLQSIIEGSFTGDMIIRAVLYAVLFIVGSVIFSIFWMQTANMDAASQAKQIMNSGLQIPGFRRDERVLEKILSRYIWPLTIVGGGAVGLLAATADLIGSLSQGTSILLAVMIVYKLYEEIAKQHVMDLHPAMRKFVE